MNHPTNITGNEEIKEPKKSFPTIEMDTKGPDFNSQKKRPEAQQTDAEGTEETQAPEVNDQQKAP